eukprot:3940784-Rhodomonas_salina.1
MSMVWKPDGLHVNCASVILSTGVGERTPACVFPHITVPGTPARGFGRGEGSRDTAEERGHVTLSAGEGSRDPASAEERGHVILHQGNVERGAQSLLDHKGAEVQNRSLQPPLNKVEHATAPLSNLHHPPTSYLLIMFTMIWSMCGIANFFEGRSQASCKAGHPAAFVPKKHPLDKATLSLERPRFMIHGQASFM